MNNRQFNDVRNSDADIEERMKMEVTDLLQSGLPDDAENLTLLLTDAKIWIAAAKRTYGIPANWPVQKGSYDE